MLLLNGKQYNEGGEATNSGLGNSDQTLGKKVNSVALRLPKDEMDQKSNWITLTKEVGKSSSCDFFQTWLDKDSADVIYNATSRRRLDKTSLHWFLPTNTSVI